MGNILIAVLGFSGYVLPVPSLICGWAAWLRSQRRFGSPVWRFVAAFSGLTVASMVGLLTVVVILTVGGMPESGRKYELAMKSSGFGFLTSIFALVLSLTGKGPVRLPASLGSFGLAAFWFVAAFLY